MNVVLYIIYHKFQYENKAEFEEMGVPDPLQRQSQLGIAERLLECLCGDRDRDRNRKENWG